MITFQNPGRIGRYQLISELGRGSMGAVYLAEDPNIDRKVAIKVLHLAEEISVDLEEVQQRFLLEARAAGRLNHPGIVQVYDAGTDRKTDLSYIVMEWVKGGSLATLLRESGTLPPERAINLVSQAAHALDYAHQRGLVHRDVKPANLLVTANDRVKLSDFGVAKFVSHSFTVGHRLLGSPYYMSPEQIQAMEVDGRSDLFSLGGVLYQCVTGVVPYDGDSIASITYQILEIEARPPSSMNIAVPESLAQVIDRAMRKDPAERFQRGGELADALADVKRELAEAEPQATAAASPKSTPAPEIVRGEGKRTASGTLLLEPEDARIDVPPSTSEREPPEEPQIAVRPRGGPFRKSLLWLAVAILLAALAGLGFVVSQLDVDWLFSKPTWPDKGPAASAGNGRLSGAEREAAEGATAAATAPVMAATLEVLYRNRLKGATMTVEVDGRTAWSQQLRGSGGLFKRAKGREVKAAVSVPAGSHSITVRITGKSGDVHASGSREAAFRPGETRRLRVSLGSTGKLGLDWQE